MNRLHLDYYNNITMLETIKKLLFLSYQPTDIRWLFISAFSAADTLLVSHGVLHTDKQLNQLVDTLYTSVVAPLKNIKYIILDVVLSQEVIRDMQMIPKINCNENGIFVQSLQDTKSGVLLPQTAGITNAIQALQAIKQKYALEGNVEITTFKTHRIVISL